MISVPRRHAPYTHSVRRKRGVTNNAPTEQGTVTARCSACREILAPRHFEGLTNGESAEVLGLSKTAANNRYIRALGRLRGLLEHARGFFEER